MRNKEIEEPALVNIERHPLIVVISAAISALLIFETYQLLNAMNPWGFMMLAPTGIVSFQTLWLILTPFALVFKNKIEIKPSFFQHKDHYFIDIKRIAQNKKGKMYITYQDDEIERISLFGIRPSHVALFKSEVEKMIGKPLSTTS